MSSQRCFNCAAPLPLAVAGQVVSCTFCNTENRLEGGAPAAPQVVVQPMEPQVFQAMIQVSAPTVPRASAKGVGLFVALMVGLPIVGVVGGLAAMGWGLQSASRRTTELIEQSNPIPRAAQPTEALTRPAELGKHPGGGGYITVDPAGMTTTFDQLEPVAELPWAERVARAWSPDAKLYALYVSGVREDGTLDTSAARSDADYRFFSPARRRAAREMQTVSDSAPPTELRLLISDGKAQVLLGSSTEPDESTSAKPAFTCAMRDVVALLHARKLPQRPGYNLMARVRRRGEYTWSLNMPNVRERVEEISTVCSAAPPRR